SGRGRAREDAPRAAGEDAAAAGELRGAGEEQPARREPLRGPQGPARVGPTRRADAPARGGERVRLRWDQCPRAHRGVGRISGSCYSRQETPTPTLPRFAGEGAWSF